MAGGRNNDEAANGTGTTGADILGSESAASTDEEPLTQAEPEGEGDLAEQVERVVSLLHRLETLYAESPQPTDDNDYDLATGQRSELSDFDVSYDTLDRPAESFEDRLAQGLPTREFVPLRRDSIYVEASSGPLPPSLSEPLRLQFLERADDAAPADEGQWYRGALREHQEAVPQKSKITARIGMLIASVLVAFLALPWIIALFLGPNWERTIGERSFQTAELPSGRNLGPMTPVVPDEAVATDASPWAATVTQDGPPDPVPQDPSTQDPTTADAEVPKSLAQEAEPVARSVIPEMAPPEGVTPSSAPTPEPDVTPDTARSLATPEQVTPADPRSPALERIFALRKAQSQGDWTRAKEIQDEIDREGAREAEQQMATWVPPKDPSLAYTSCDEALVVADQKTLRLTLDEPGRAGTTLKIQVDDFDYRASFAADGKLSLEAPRFKQESVVRWLRNDNAPCTRPITAAGEASVLHVALVWKGEVGLELHVVEPGSWPGNTTGYVSPLQSNDDSSRGAGSLRTFGMGSDPVRIQVYSVFYDRIAKESVFNVQVRLAPRLAGGGTCGSIAGVFDNEELPYDIYIVRDGGAAAPYRREVQSFAFKVPPCGATASQQDATLRLPIRF